MVDNSRTSPRRRAVLISVVLLLIGAGVLIRVTATDSLANWRASRMPDNSLAKAAADPNASFPYLFTWARRLEGSARFTEAEHIYSRALLVGPSRVDAWIGFGRTAYAAGDWGKADAELRKTVELWPDNAEARFSYAAILGSTFRIHRAIDQMHAGVKLNPANGRAWMTLGELEMRVGDAAAAVDAYSHATKLIPSTPKLHSYYGAALLSTDKYAEAKTELEIALKDDPSDINSRFEMGKALAYGGKKEDRARAMKELNRVVEFSFNKSRAYAESAKIWLREGERSNALQYLEVAFQLNQTNPEMLKLLQQTYSETGRSADAEKLRRILERVQKLTDDRSNILLRLDSGEDIVTNLIRLGRVDKALDNPVEARSAFGAARSLDPANAEAAAELTGSQSQQVH